MSVPIPKEMVRRSVAIALGIICIILVAGLGVVIYMSYSPTTGSSITSLQNQLNQLQDTYNSYAANHHHTDSEYDSLSSQNVNLQNQKTTLQNQVDDLTNTLNLGKSTVWVNDQTVSQPASSFTVWTVSASYAGYVSVWVQSSTVSGTHVKTIYSSHGVSFNQEKVISAGDTAVFPILPASSIQVEVGNGNLVNGATETVTITYYY